ncbi:MAG: hypothetical protein QOD96_6078 [Pseudonocardiales bacterium]|nr:hypothetical protein [Pseudonocardiales bacterium]
MVGTIRALACGAVLLALGMGVVAVLRLSGGQAPGQPARLAPANLAPAPTGTSATATPGNAGAEAAAPVAPHPESDTPTTSADKLAQPRTGGQALPKLDQQATQQTTQQATRMRHAPESPTQTEAQANRRNEQVRREMIDRLCERYNLPADRCEESKDGSDF